MEPTLFVLAFLFGVGTFFSPCAVALLPAYVGYFAGKGASAAAIAPRPDRSRAFYRGARFGAAAAAGILVVFVLFATVIYLVRVHAHLPSFRLAAGLEALGVAVGVLVLLLGILMLLGKAPTWTPRVAAPQGRGLGSMMFFGGLYALASLGCTLPLFFSVFVQSLVAGPVTGSLMLVAYAVGFAGLMFLGTLLLTVAEDSSRRTLRRILPYVRPASGILLIAAGLFVLYYYLVLVPPL